MAKELLVGKRVRITDVYIGTVHAIDGQRIVLWDVQHERPGGEPTDAGDRIFHAGTVFIETIDDQTDR